jgi:hypothetical protein
MRQDRRGSWYLLTGAVLGVAIGLFYSWVISPVEYVDAPPYALRADYKDEYRALVAAAYLYSNDILRAEDRLAQLKDDETAQSIAKQAQQALAEGRPEAEVKALGSLAMALNQGLTPEVPSIVSTPMVTNSLPTEPGTATPLLIQPTATPSSSPQLNPILETAIVSPEPSNTPQPTRTPVPTATPGAPFVLQTTTLACNPNQSEPLIQVEILDAAGQPVPGIELVVTWDGGEDHFFTGLKSELGMGYGDFVMTPDVVYTVQLAEGGEPENDLSAAECVSEDGERFWGSWMLKYIQP